MKVAIFVGGYFESAHKFTNIGEAKAFKSGVEDCANLLSSQEVSVYVLPNEDKAMRDNETKEEVAAAIAYKL